MGMDNEDIAIAINNERMGLLQGNLGREETSISHYESAVEAYRRLGDTAKVAQLEAHIAGIKQRLAARATRRVGVGARERELPREQPHTALAP